MPGIALEGQMSTGHDCYKPTTSLGPYTTTSFFSDKRIQLRGITRYNAHTCGKTTHTPEQRVVVDPGNSTFFLEGLPVAMIGDLLTDGDCIAEGAESSFTI